MYDSTPFSLLSIWIWRFQRSENETKQNQNDASTSLAVAKNEKIDDKKTEKNESSRLPMISQHCRARRRYLWASESQIQSLITERKWNRRNSYTVWRKKSQPIYFRDQNQTNPIKSYSIQLTFKFQATTFFPDRSLFKRFQKYEFRSGPQIEYQSTGPTMDRSTFLLTSIISASTIAMQEITNYNGSSHHKDHLWLDRCKNTIDSTSHECDKIFTKEEKWQKSGIIIHRSKCDNFSEHALGTRSSILWSMISFESFLTASAITKEIMAWMTLFLQKGTNMYLQLIFQESYHVPNWEKLRS